MMKLRPALDLNTYSATPGQQGIPLKGFQDHTLVHQEHLHPLLWCDSHNLTNQVIRCLVKSISWSPIQSSQIQRPVFPIRHSERFFFMKSTSICWTNSRGLFPCFVKSFTLPDLEVAKSKASLRTVSSPSKWLLMKRSNWHHSRTVVSIHSSALRIQLPFIVRLSDPSIHLEDSQWYSARAIAILLFINHGQNGTGHRSM